MADKCDAEFWKDGNEYPTYQCDRKPHDDKSSHYDWCRNRQWTDRDGATSDGGVTDG